MTKYVNPSHEKLKKSEVENLVGYLKNSLSQKKAHVKVTESKSQFFGKPHKVVQYTRRFDSHHDMMKIIRKHELKLPDNFETSMDYLRQFLKDNHFKTHGELLIEELINNTGVLHVGNYNELDLIKNPHTGHDYEYTRENKLFIPNYPRGIEYIMHNDNFMPIVNGLVV